MLTEEKIKQTRKLISKGNPEGEIKNLLREEGYSEEEIKEIFKPQPYDMRSWLLVFGVLFCLLGFYLIVNGKDSWHSFLFGAGLLAQCYRLDAKHKQQTEAEQNG
jgi:hypothetical protein